VRPNLRKPVPGTPFREYGVVTEMTALGWYGSGRRRCRPINGRCVTYGTVCRAGLVRQFRVPGGSSVILNRQARRLSHQSPHKTDLDLGSLGLDNGGKGNALQIPACLGFRRHRNLRLPRLPLSLNQAAIGSLKPKTPFPCTGKEGALQTLTRPARAGHLW